MHSHKAGLYTPATIAAWLLATGLASPPVLVLLGLTLPDSRILNGIAGIGMTLANIADLIPYLRKSIIDTTHPNHDTPAFEITLNDGVWSNGSRVIQGALQGAASVVFVAVSPREGEHICASSGQSGCLTLTEPSNGSAIDHQNAPFALSTPSLPLWGKEDEKVHVKLKTSPPANFPGIDLNTNDTSVLDDEAAQLIPDTIEDAPFTTGSVLSIDDPREGCSTIAPVEFDENEGTTFTPRKISVQAEDDSEGGASPSDSPRAQRHVLEGAQTTQWQEVKPELARRLRPESLVFIPQSVIRRFPPASLASETPHYGHQAFGYDYQAMSVPLAASIDQQAMLLDEGARASTWASSVTLGERPPPPQLFQWEDTLNEKVDITAEEPPAGGQGLVLGSAADQAPFEKAQTSLSSQGPTPEDHTLQLKSSYGQYRPHSGRRLGVLARAALRNRRYNRVRSDDSRSTDDDLESDSDSQSSRGSSADESMLGSDLIAAIDANSEWELNLDGSIKTAPPLHEDFPPSEDSTTDISLILHGPSTIDASDTDVRAPATPRSLTYEDIQNWATGVVHTCVKQVHRDQAPVPPHSPSQVSEVCAERPLIPGISLCPLAGHHCKPGASVAAGSEVPAPKLTETTVSVPQPATQPTRKPLVVRNIRDIPEFVPRQRPISVVISKRVENPLRYRTRSMVQVALPRARDAAGELIARMESQVGFDTWGRKEDRNGAYWVQPARGQLERHAERSRFRLA